MFALLTVCKTVAEVLALKLVSPLYTAVMECVAIESVLVANVATPPVNVLVASGVAPLKNVTVPVGGLTLLVVSIRRRIKRRS